MLYCVAILLVTGGTNAEISVEAFIPGVGTCKLHDLPNNRTDHIMETIDDKPVICCGEGSDDHDVSYECLQFTPTVSSGRNFGIWENYARSTRVGGGNLGSWVSSAGLVLLRDHNEVEILNTTKTIEIEYPRCC